MDNIEDIETLVEKIFSETLFDETYMDADWTKYKIREAICNADEDTLLWIKKKFSM